MHACAASSCGYRSAVPRLTSSLSREDGRPYRVPFGFICWFHLLVEGPKLHGIIDDFDIMTIRSCYVSLAAIFTGHVLPLAPDHSDGSPASSWAASLPSLFQRATLH